MIWTSCWKLIVFFLDFILIMKYVDLWVSSLENQTKETLNTVASRTLSYIEDCYGHPVRMTTTVRTKSSLMCRTINFSLICCHYIPCVLILVIARRLFKKCEKNFIKNMYKCQSEKLRICITGFLTHRQLR